MRKFKVNRLECFVIKVIDISKINISNINDRS